MRFVLGGVAVAALAAVLTAIPYAFPAAWWLEVATSCTALTDISLTAGSLLAALAFSRGDPLRGAWLWVSASGFTGLISTLTQGPNIHDGVNPLLTTPMGIVLGGAIDIVLNLTMIIGFIQFARAWKTTGMSPPGQRTATLVALALGLAVAGPALWRDAHRSITGTHGAIGGTISDLGDIVSIALAGPLFAAALWIRGGALAGPYIYLTSSVAAWLLYDAGSLLPLGDARDLYDMFFTTAGTLFSALAGFLHYWVIRHSPKR